MDLRARLEARRHDRRYYEQRGLLLTVARRGGRRVYGPDQLRRLAFLQIVHRLGISLDAAAALLDAPSDQWRRLCESRSPYWSS